MASVGHLALGSSALGSSEEQNCVLLGNKCWAKPEPNHYRLHWTWCPPKIFMYWKYAVLWPDGFIIIIVTSHVIWHSDYSTYPLWSKACSCKWSAMRWEGRVFSSGY